MRLHRFLKLNTIIFFGLVSLVIRSFAADTTSTALNLEDLLDLQITTTSKQAEKISDAPGVFTFS